MEILTETAFFKSVSGASDNQEFKTLYRDFTYKVVELYNSADMDFSKLVFTLHHTNIELASLHDIESRAEIKDEILLTYLHKAMLFTETAINYLDKNSMMNSPVHREGDAEPDEEFIWTGKKVNLVEMLYSVCEDGNINGGRVNINKFIGYIARLLSIEVGDCYAAYSDIKRRADESRTYFLDRLALRFNQRMDREDEK